MIKFKLPPVASNCIRCKRPLSGRLDSEYSPWCVPVNGNTCTLCSETERGGVSENLPAESQEALTAYLSLRS